jgi:hypothetical protein
MGILQKAKSYHLFAKGTEMKTRLLKSMVRQTSRLLSEAGTLRARLAGAGDSATTTALEKLSDMQEVGAVLLPQILSWIKTGVVATNKIVHAGIPMARAIVRNKAGKKCEFGLRHLIVSLKNGYLMSQEIGARASEFGMPALALKIFRDLFGDSATPELFVYDRGAWSRDNVSMLKAEGVQKIGIQPKGKCRSRVRGRDKIAVLQQRSRIEGKIGTLKTAYGMDRPRERLGRTVAATTPRSVASFNLNKMMRDLMINGQGTAA